MSGYQRIGHDDIEMTSQGGTAAGVAASSGSSSSATAPAAPSKCSLKYILSGAGIIILLAVSAVCFVSFDNTSSSPYQKSEANFDEANRFIMRNFDVKKPMSDFLNGLGGLWGVPMWAFFVNRGQAIASFGLKNKDGAIQKFLTAEKSYQQTQFTGFRTFVKGKIGKKSFQHQPFFPQTASLQIMIERNLYIGENEIEIEERNRIDNLQTNIVYFTVPNEDFAALVRKTTFTNTDAKETMELEVLDGLEHLEPFGLTNGGLDSMGRTSEAWMRVYNVGKAGDGGVTVTEPFYHVTQSTADTAQVSLVKEGNFVVAFIEDGPVDEASGLYSTLPFIVDPSVVFGFDTSLVEPTNFFDDGAPKLDAFMESAQGVTARTPCAFAGVSLKLAPGQSVSVVSVYGKASKLESFIGKISPKVRTPGFVTKKRAAADVLVANITKNVATSTASVLFDEYVKQDYLDNVLRGGLPLPMGDSEEPKIFHTFSRIHGDLERDYNNFDIDTTYFSQGPGNFRDVSQNRRLDVTLAPFVRDFNVRMFLSLEQADGYNPLTVASTNFKVSSSSSSSSDESAVKKLIKALQVADPQGDGVPAKAVAAVLSKPFRPGQFFQDTAAAGVTFGISKEEVLNKIVAAADQSFAAKFAQNGFWADHWTYTMDLVTDYLSVYPDKEEKLLWESNPVPFFMSPAFVLPRSQRYSLVADDANPGKSTIRVYRPITVWGDADFPVKLNDALLEMLAVPEYVGDSTGAGTNWMFAKHTKKPFLVSVGAKLLMLGTIKFSTMDPYGMGVEMEGGKPGWNDAMNGLPGIVGSGMPETYEMLKIVRFMKAAVSKFNRGIAVPTEYALFLDAVQQALDDFNAVQSPTVETEFVYWNATNTARETYRTEVMTHFAGSTEELSASYLSKLLGDMEAKVEAGIKRAVAENGDYSPTYFSYECTDYRILPVKDTTADPPAPTAVEALAFKQNKLPMFLEGPTRYMKVLSDTSSKKDVYEKTKASPLYDEALKMYTLSESLKSMGADVGRMVAFSPGWLENQSVWLHMSYKFYLELLRGGLYDEFFAEMQTGVVPFMDVDVYGRSPLEAASFIVSSAFPDKKLHGTGFLARLSGSTAEFLSMWALMMAGPAPFSLDSDGNLQLSLQPAIPSWLFPEDGTVSFTFLGAITVVYNNPKKLDTWKLTAKSGSITDTDGNTEYVDSGVFSAHQAEKVRKLEISTITVDLD